MTPEKLIQIGDFLRNNPLSFNELSALNIEDVNYILSYLTPNGPFNDEQRYWLRRWFLSVTPELVNQLNSLLPSNTRISPIEYKGQLYISSDLLSDEKTFGTVHSLLKDRKLIYILPEDLAAYRNTQQEGL